jgi:hypothetical protein
MATKIYDSETINLVDGTEIYLTPLKIKYLREFMLAFDNVKSAKSDEDATLNLLECVRISMQQYFPTIKTIEQLEDSVNMPNIYKILEIAAGIKINEKSEEPVKQQAVESGSSWETLDLATLESEVFLLGIWKDYEELETSLSMPELTAILNVKRDSDYSDKRFLAAMQGVDLDKESGKSNANAWEEMKARVYSKGQATNSKDVLALQGMNAQKAGFGIGMGLTYEKIE